MTIDKEQLISLLIDKTGLSPEEVESQLSELINRIKQAAEKGKTFEIEGFGVFSMEDGNLQFEPHDTLQTEINNKYAGMKPIELIGAFKDSEGDEVPDMPEEEFEKSEGRWTFDESAMEEETEEPVEKKTDSENAQELVEQFEKKQQESAPKEEDTQEDVEEELERESAEEPAAPKPDDKEPAQQKQTAVQVSDNADDDSEKDMIGQLLVAIVVVIALGVGGWLVYDAGFSASTNTPQQNSGQTVQQVQVPDQQTGDSQQESSSQQSENAKTSEPEPDKPVTNQEGSATDAATQQNKFGLEGTYDQSVGGYTIVVHSLKSMQRAEKNRQRLEAEGFRTLINEAAVGGTTYFRVGIGQFETVRDAMQAMSNLPERYRENNFIKRIK